VTTFDGHAVKHEFSRPSPSVFAYCKRSKTGGVEGLGTRLHYTTNEILFAMSAQPNANFGDSLPQNCTTNIIFSGGVSSMLNQQLHNLHFALNATNMERSSSIL